MNRENVAVRGVAGRQGHQRRGCKYCNDGTIGDSLGITDFLSEMSPQIVVAAYTFSVDERLWRRLDVVLAHERVAFLARGQPPVVYRIALALQQVLGLQAIRTGVVFHRHPVERGISG